MASRSTIFVSAALLFITPMLTAQHVGVGTLEPEYRLDIRTRNDTTLQVKTVGINGLASTNRVRLGILNILDSTTAGSRIGMHTNIAFPNSPGGEQDSYIGHEIQFDGFCFPIGSGCNESSIYGLKIDIPLFANDGTHYGVYSSAPRLTGYAGYFNGRGYFSRMVGIGAEPTDAQQLRVVVDSEPLAQLHTAGRFTINAPSANLNTFSIYSKNFGDSPLDNYSGYFTTSTADGNAYGVYGGAFTSGTGISYGIYAENSSVNSNDRYGLVSEVSGNASGRMHGIRSILSGNSTAGQAVYGIESSIEPYVATGRAYGIRSTISNNATNNESYAFYGVNNNDGHSAYLDGKSQIVNGEFASPTTDGYLQLGFSNNNNLILDNNEILARDNGNSSSLLLQYPQGDVLMCGTGTGSVGIGWLFESFIPANTRLSVNGNSHFNGQLLLSAGEEAGYGTNGFIQIGESDDWNIVIDQNEILARNNGQPNVLRIQQNGGDLLLCEQATGSVGIGVENPANIPDDYILAVDGKMISEEVRVELSAAWPDYVFSDSYRLAPLQDVEKFIETNGHLPNIPSAEEIEEKGQHLGELQRKLMEKVEELTLYVIQLEKEVQRLKTQ